MRRWLPLLVALAAGLALSHPAWADPGREAAKVVAGYFYSAEAEDLQAHLATRDLAPGQRQKTAEFVQAIWDRVGTRKVKVGRVEVALSPDGRQALARCTVNGEVVNKETGQSFAKQTTYVAVLVLRDGQWKVRRVVPESVFRRRLREDFLARQAQRLVEAADKGASALAGGRPAPKAAGGQGAAAQPARQAQRLGDLIASTAPAALSPSPDPLRSPSQPPPPAQEGSPPPERSSPAASAAGGLGRILRVKGGMVFIDRGAANGVTTGQRLEVVSFKEITHPVTGKKMRLPKRMAVILVRQVWENQARCLILESLARLGPGLSVMPAASPAK